MSISNYYYYYTIYCLIALISSNKAFINTTIKHKDNYWSQFLKQFLKYNFNIVIYFDDQTPEPVILQRTSYVANLTFSIELLKQFNQSNIKPNSFIVINPTIKDLEAAINAIKKSDVAYIAAQYIVVLETINNINKIANVLLKNLLNNSAVLANKKVFVINSRGTKSKAKFVGRYDNISLEECKYYAGLYPKNTTLHVIWSTYAPDFFMENNQLTGITHDSLKAFESASSVQLKFRPDNSAYLESMKATKDFKLVKRDLDNNYGDIYFGPVQVNSKNRFDIGPTLWFKQLNFFIPKRAKLHRTSGIFSSISVPSLILALSVFFLWIMFVSVLINVSLNRKLFDLFTNNLMMNVSFLLSISYKIKSYNSLVAKLLIGSILIVTVPLTAFNQGSIFSTVTRPLPIRPIKNLKDLLELNMPMIIPDAAIYYFPNKTDIYFQKLKTRRSKSNKSIENLANEMINKTDVIVVVNSGYMMMHPKTITTHLFLQICTQGVMPIMKRNHYLTEHVFDRIQRLLETGILDKYKNLYAFKFNLAEDWSTADQKNPQISLRDLSGFYEKYFFGIMTSVFAFIGEVLFKKNEERLKAVYLRIRKSVKNVEKLV